MSDYGRIHRRFPTHPKVQHAVAIAGNGAIGLWTLCNADSRDHHRSGFIPAAVAEMFGTQQEIDALVDAGLWEKVDGGYRFHDYEEWNADDVRGGAKGSAAWIVQQCVPDHPQAVKDRLASEVLKLVDEGFTLAVIKAALERWLTKPESPPSWLPLFASDCLRADDSLITTLREVWRSGETSRLHQFGYMFTPPDPPLGMSVYEVKKFMLDAKRAWVKEIQKGLT